MASRLNIPEELEHRPARSGTPTAWMALALLGTLVAGWLFLDSIVCGIFRVGLAGIAWNQRVKLSIDHLALTEYGTVKALGVALTYGAREHRSSWKSDWIEMRLPTLGNMLGFGKNNQRHQIPELSLGKTKLLLDQRAAGEVSGHAGKQQRLPYKIPWIRFLPDALSAGPVELVVIGENYRVSVRGLYFFLPDRWAGKVVYSEAILDLGTAHQVFSAASAPASWNGSTLHLGRLVLSKDLRVEELTLSPRKDRLEFGLRGGVGDGIIRGDGSLGDSGSKNALEATLVGENLKLETVASLLKAADRRAAGTIRLGRFTFRGNPDKPLEADSSLRLLADAFRWEGRGWDSLRLAATLTGQVLTLSELSLQQKENEVEASGVSRLPEDWHAVLKAPFTATFHAMLDDAGALAALAGPDLAQLSGGLFMEGKIKGAENKAEGYCNLLGTGMKLRNLPLDWLKGCMIFEGGKTRLSNLEAWSGNDRIVMDGVVENSLPHIYAAKAAFSVGNLTKRLAQLGISTASQIGGGALQGTWIGDGSNKGHAGTFQAHVKDWISPWTKAGMSGSFEGSYSPGRLYCSKAEFQQADLRLSLQLTASPTRLEAKSIVARRNGRPDPLVQGEISLPVNAPALWQTGDIISNLGMKDPLVLHLTLHGIKAEELADLLGQNSHITGTLEGDLSATGTPESPEVHSALKIGKLTLSDATPTMGLTCRFDSTGGRVSFHLAQGPAKEGAVPPLILDGDIPFRLVTDQGGLRFADPTAPVHAVAAVHRFPLNGWMSLWSGSTWTLRDGMLDGALNIDGTIDKPFVDGNLVVTALGAALPGIPDLTGLKLPVTCSLSKATSKGGTALYGDKPIAISGTLDWSSSPWVGRIGLSGKDISFPKVGEIASQGDAEVSLQQQGTNAPLLAGKLLIKALSGTLPSRVMPFFAPPGVMLTTYPAFPCAPVAGTGTVVSQLDLQVRTAGWLSLCGSMASNATKLKAEFQLQGEGLSPRWIGNIQAKDYFLELPAGRFVIPEAKLQSDAEGREQLTFTAYGMTKLGFCTLGQDGPPQAQPWIDAATAAQGITVSDIVLALSTSQNTGIGISPLPQMPAWIRQNTLFSMPPTGWMTRRMGKNDAGELGFYGSPWIALLLTTPVTASLPDSPAHLKTD